jgi:cytochrome c
MQAKIRIIALLFAGFIMANNAVAEEKTANADPALLEETALDLAQNNGCFTCHAVDKKIIGPAWIDVATKYRDDVKAEAWLVSKVSKGGNGVWGHEVAMPPFSPYMQETDIRTLVQFILTLR